MPEEFADAQFLISVDHDSYIFIDKKPLGIIKVDEFLTFAVVTGGEHYIEAKSLDGEWSWHEKVYVENGSQKIIEISMIPSDPTVGILGEFKDLRDNNKYLTVTIKGVTWMAENLRYKSPNSLDLNNDPSNAKAYGKFYLFDDAGYACPRGWHLPSNKEWEDLTKLYLPKVSKELRLGGRSNFNLTFAGHCLHDYDTIFKNTDSSCNYWTNTPKKYNGGNTKLYLADTMYIDADKHETAPVICNIGNNKYGHFVSIRCVKDEI